MIIMTRFAQLASALIRIREWGWQISRVSRRGTDRFEIEYRVKERASHLNSVRARVNTPTIGS
jgi:hypothetical protein